MGYVNLLNVMDFILLKRVVLIFIFKVNYLINVYGIRLQINALWHVKGIMRLIALIYLIVLNCAIMIKLHNNA